MTDPKLYMQQALLQASHGLGRTAPNPPVGAVIVRDDVIVGTGFHPEAGQPHAEIFALQQAGELARGSDVYVTLEPCSHHGRTGPCVEALINAGIKKVYVGAIDPNPQVSGQGVKHLKAAGVEVVCGVLEDQCEKLIAPFAKHITTGLPYVIFKSAMTLDGQTSTSSGESRWISCEESRTMVHQLRDRVDAIMVGSGTVVADNPQLTTRLVAGGRDPVRIVVDNRLETSPEALVYKQETATLTLLLTSEHHDDQRLSAYRHSASVKVIPCPQDGDHLDLHQAMLKVGELDLQTILLEGGNRLAGAMLKAGLIDRIMLYIAPLMFGGDDGGSLFSGPGVSRLVEAFRLTDLRSTRIGTDILIEGEVAECSPD